MNFPKIYLACLLVAFGTNAGATDVKVDNGSTLPGAQIQSIQINPTTNVMHIVTVSGNYTIAPVQTNPNDPVVDLLVNGGTSATVATGTSVTLSWNVSNAVSCSTTGGNTAWQSIAITPNGSGIASGSLNTIINSTSTQSYGLNCVGAAGSNPANDSVNITGVAASLPAVTLLVGGFESISVSTGSTINISWNVSNSDSCVTSGGNAAWQAKSIVMQNGSSSGNMDITVDFTQLTQFTLQCTRAPNSASDFVTVEVETNCPVSPLATGLTPEQRANLVKSWSSIFSSAWPDPSFGSRLVSLSRGRYMAIEFNTGNQTGIDGGLKTVTSTLTEGSRLGAISRCPGDFFDHLAVNSGACKRLWYIGGSLSWTTAPNPQFYECSLEPNTTYYLNLTFTDGKTTASDSCRGNVCATNVDVWHN